MKLSLLAVGCLLQQRAVEACTAMLVGPKASVDGTLTTHTNDCFDCDFRLSKVPAKDHAAGSTRPIYMLRGAYPRYVGYERGETYFPENVQRGKGPTGLPLPEWQQSEPIGFIPQVPHTYAYVDGLYGIMNEHQLAIGESTCRGRLIAKPVFAGGSALFEVSELTRIALERCQTARCAVNLMGGLAEEHGYFGSVWEGPDALSESGEALTVVDKQEAWHFHIHPDDTGSSAVWAAQRIPADHVSVVANMFVIRELGDDPEWFLFSSNVRRVARRLGFWDPDKDGVFNFQRAYSLPFGLKAPYATRRVWRVFSTVAPSLRLPGDSDQYGDDYPVSVKAEIKMSAATLMQLHRDHFEGTPYDNTRGLDAGPFGNPVRYDATGYQSLTDAQADEGLFERSIGMMRAVYSFVATARPYVDDRLGCFWVAGHHAAGSFFSPIYVAPSQLPAPFTTGSRYHFDHGSFFWVGLAVSNYMEKAWLPMLPDVQAHQKQLEDRAGTLQRQVEQKAAALLDDASNVDNGGDTQREDRDETTAVTHLYAFSDANARQATREWGELLFFLLNKFHDGYRVDDYEADYLLPTCLFYPEWWLEKVNFWGRGHVGPHPTPVTKAYATNIIPPEASLPDKSTPSFGRLYQGFVEPALPVSLVATTTDFKAASSGEGWVAWLLTVLFSATAGAAATALGTHLYGKRVLRSRYRAL